MVVAHNPLPSRRLRVFSVNSAPSASKPPRSAFSQRHDAPTTQLLPSFSTPSKHRARTNARNSFPIYALLHTFRHTPGRGYPRPASAVAPHPTPLLTLPVTHLNATLTGPPAAAHSKALTPKLNPLDATFAKNPGGPSTRILFVRRLFTSLRPSLKFATLSP